MSRPIPPATKNPPMPKHGMEIERYDVASWCPTPDGSGKAEQVHLGIVIKGLEDITMVLRFKSSDALDQFMDVLKRHREDVWGVRNA